MQRKNGQLSFSPTDLTTYFKSPFASWMKRYCFENPSEKVDLEDDPTLSLLAAKGDAHERTYLQKLKLEHPDLIEIEKKDFQIAAAKTIEAMKAGVSVIYQGALQFEEFLGYSDFLIRREVASSLGAYHYEVWDTKLARHTKPEYLLQLCCYSEMLEAIQGVFPKKAAIVLGNQVQEHFILSDFLHYYSRFKGRFKKFHADFDPKSRPMPQTWEDFGEWGELAAQILAEQDHLSLVAGISTSQTKRLEKGGIQTFSALASAEAAQCPDHFRKDLFKKLSKQAALQKLSEKSGKTEFELIRYEEEKETPLRYGLTRLPTMTSDDVYFDMEGYPLADDGLEYLFGAIYLKDEKPEFIDWWATSKDQEKKAFEDWIDWAFKRWKKNPKMHIYHYAAYEVTAMKKLMGEHMTRAFEVDEFLRNNVFIDLYQIVRESIVVGAPSYSIKKLEDLYGFKRQGDVKSAGDSVVQFAEWLELRDGADWKSSSILKLIRDYNEEDCVSTWHLTQWLRALQKREKILPVLNSDDEEGREREPEMKPHETLAKKLLDVIPDDESTAHMHAVLAAALGYHDREKKPQWWAYFNRLSSHPADLMEDSDCLAECKIEKKTAEGIHISFSSLQDTKMGEGSTFIFHHNPKKGGAIEKIDLSAGTAVLSVKNSDELPTLFTLLPGGPISTDAIEKSIYETALAWSLDQDLNRVRPALRDLICRTVPRIKGISPGRPIITDEDQIVQQTIEACLNLQESILAIQGPPGTGKTYTASHVIANLILNGKKIGVISNGHKAVNHVMIKAFEVLKEMKKEDVLKAFKIRNAEEEDLVAGLPHKRVDGATNFWKTKRDFNLVGGTQWFFAHQSARDQFDYLFIEEAGQFSLASAIAVQSAAKNLVLLGDQMQLEQPIQGAHPEVISQSVLGYYLEDHSTVPPEKGVFLGVSRRMRPEVCRFISDAIYDGKLNSHPETHKNTINQLGSPEFEKTSGVLFIPIEHEGNTQSSLEEVKSIQSLIATLKTTTVTEGNHPSHPFSINDCLFVAPYNVQVGLLRNALGDEARVGSVDLFQGQEAPVVFFSMCSSSGDASPRGLEFLLNQNRINVAISRAKTLAVVVGNPALADARVTSVDKMRQVSLFCRIIEESGK